MPELERSIQVIKGVGIKRAQLMAKLGIYTIKDLIYYFPKKYISVLPVEDFSLLKTDQAACIQGIVKKVAARRIKFNLTITEANISSGEGEILAIWYNKSNLEQKLVNNQSIKLYGKIELFNGKLYIKVLEIIPPDYATPFLPVYPSTGNLRQSFWRNIMKDALCLSNEEVIESLPRSICEKYQFIPLKEALKAIHFPASIEDLKKARARLIYQELFFYLIEQDKIKKSSKNIAHSYKINPQAVRSLIDLLPIKLTNGQELAVKEILADMGSNGRMYRLIQGDVGCGKTVVALCAILSCFASGYQSVLMVPTEVLAEQHYNTVKELTACMGLKTVLLTSSSRNRQETEKIIELGQANLIIGTQTLIQEKIHFRNIGLVVIDEQHKFGMLDRDKLVEKCNSAHILMMSATPIPKTLALSLYGDLDLTTISDMPLGRKNIKTYYVPEEKKDNMQVFIKERLLLGNQGYWVCPAIEGSSNEMSSAEKTFEELQHILAPCRIELIHGRLNPPQREEILYNFSFKKSIGLLVATTIIEVGVNNPNATIMVIDGFERFGLAQLHQLRGRVGRGNEQAYCFLLGKREDPLAKKRLEILIRHSDGFTVAEQDFNLRGPGNINCTRQHGAPSFRLANLVRDKKILENCYQDIQNNNYE